MKNDIDVHEPSNSNIVAFPDPSPPPPKSKMVRFDRMELGLILRSYGHKVARGEWRDYAIDMLPNCAMFSVYRHSCEMPVYQIVKDPKLARRQGAYFIRSASGQIVKRGRDLARMLRYFEEKPRLVSV